MKRVQICVCLTNLENRETQTERERERERSNEQQNVERTYLGVYANDGQARHRPLEGVQVRDALFCCIQGMLC